MNQLKRKLRSNAGASMILALALCLICITVASIIIFSASSGTSRNVDRTKQQRGYLAVSSAAQLVAEELENRGSLIVNQNATIHPCKDYRYSNEDLDHGTGGQAGYLLPDGTVFVDGRNNTVYNGFQSFIKDPYLESAVTAEVDGSGLTGVFAEVLSTAVEHISATGEPYSENIQIEPVLEDERLAPVNCSFNMNTNYTVRVIITTADSDYTITVVMAGTVAGTEEVVTDRNTHTHVVYYKQLTGTGAYVDAIGSLECVGQEKNIIQTISWNVPTINKGGTAE